MSNISQWLVGSLLLATLTGCSFSQNRTADAPASAQQATYSPSAERARFARSAYVATGIGASYLEPDTSEVPEDVNDRMNAGGQIAIGADVSRLMSLEFHSADLGSAGLSPEGRINYHIHGASALFYAGGNRNDYRRQGLTGFGRVGMGLMENSAVGDVHYTQDNRTHVLFGAGLEYVSRVGLGARLELISFDQDAQYGQFSLLYRLGKKPERKRRVIADNNTDDTSPGDVVAPVAAVADVPDSPVSPVVTPPVAAVTKVKPGTFADKVEPLTDVACDNQSANVDCVDSIAVIKDIHFNNNSAMLSYKYKAQLEKLAELLNQHAQIKLQISGYSDHYGTDAYNQGLSARRAQRVADYLIAFGVNGSRISVAGFGETNPVADNRTSAGRAANRRVEIRSLDK